MSENNTGETKLREQQEREVAARTQRATTTRGGSGNLMWKVVGGMALALLATGLIASLHDIRRYIKITTM